MRGVTFSATARPRYASFPTRTPGPVRPIRASDLCGTDLHRYRGSEPVDMITGHELCGVIEELGPGRLRH